MFLFTHSVKNIIRYRSFYLLFGILLIVAAVFGTLTLILNGAYGSAAEFLSNMTAGNNSEAETISGIIYSIKPRAEVTELLIYVSRFILISLSLYTAIMSVFRHKKDLGVCMAMGQSRAGIILCFLTEILSFAFFTAIINALVSVIAYKSVIFWADMELAEILKIYDICLKPDLTVFFQIFIIKASVLSLSSLVLLTCMLCRPPSRIIKK